MTTNQIQWYFNNTLAIKYRTNLYGNILVFTSDLRSLTISSINYDIAGRISMTAQNAAGSDSDYIDLIIEGLLEYCNAISHNYVDLQYQLVYDGTAAY